MSSIDDDKLRKASVQWVRSNRKALKQEYCNLDAHPPEDNPVTIFMAGTPGAGKTEFSKSLLQTFDNDFIRIDADDIRERLKEVGYNGSNSDIFQNAVGMAISDLYGAVLKNCQSALIDGTFAYQHWRENVERSLQHNRLVEIYYLYQDPHIAWDFVKKRERNQGRMVPKDVFIADYISSIKNVSKAKEIYGNNITVYFAKNNYQKVVEYVKIDVGSIEEFLPKVYTIEELNQLIASI